MNATGHKADSAACEAGKHALVWLLFGNLVGLWLSVLLIWPSLGLPEWSYGRWVPVHLNVQLFGWTSLPLVAWTTRVGRYQGDPTSHSISAS